MTLMGGGRRVQISRGERKVKILHSGKIISKKSSTANQDDVGIKYENDVTGTKIQLSN